MAFPVINKELICDIKLLEKLEFLNNVYLDKFGETPAFFVRSPGIINLIGQHADYNMYPVLSISIEEDILVALGANSEGLINISNFDDEYPPIILAFNDIPNEADKANIKWYDYIMAGILGVSKEYGLDPSFNILVHGTIPVGAGLSSSSALVCAAALAVAFNYGLEKSTDLGKSKLAQICATAEQYVGTKGDGMDQAVMFLAQKGFATKVDFLPRLKKTNVRLPREVTFVVAIVAQRGGLVEKTSSSIISNKKAAECKLAAKVLAKQSGLNLEKVNTLKTVANGVDKSPQQMIQLIENVMVQQTYTGKEIREKLEITLPDLENILKGFQLHDLDDQTFELQKRARYVFNEHANVLDFVKSCEDKNEKALGQAMSRSHQSLRDNFDRSHPIIDALIDCAIQHGALGARLAGGRSGACVVAVVNKDDEKSVESAMKDYMLSKGNPTTSVFLTKPYSGAFAIDPDNQSIACIDIDEKE